MTNSGVQSVEPYVPRRFERLNEGTQNVCLETGGISMGGFAACETRLEIIGGSLSVEKRNRPSILHQWPELEVRHGKYDIRLNSSAPDTAEYAFDVISVGHEWSSSPWPCKTWWTSR